jgi:acyl carrier protein
MDRMQMFLEDLSATLERDTGLADDYEFEWESMLTLLVIALVNQHFGITLDVKRLHQCRNVGDLRQAVSSRRLAA